MHVAAIVRRGYPPGVSTVPTEELVSAARAGDDRAYDQLFDRVGDRILVYIRCRLGGRLAEEVDALDVLQDTYIEAHRSFAGFVPQGRGSFTRWLCVVADHRLRDLAKRVGAGKRRAPGGALVRASTALLRIAGRGPGPGTHAAERERDEALVAGMERLSAEEREAVLLRFFHGRTLEEVATALDTSERSVRRLLGKAMLVLGDGLRAHES